jgi:Lrp/AsnC family transcriptional regulator
MKTEKLDHIDRRILKALQQDSSLSQRDLAELVGLSQNACWRRLQTLNKQGVITGSVAKIDRKKLGLDLVVFVMIKTRKHSAQWLTSFRSAVLNTPEIVDVFRIAGDYDYMLKVVTNDMESYDAVYQRLIAQIELEAVTSYFAMESIAENRPFVI